MLFKGSLGFVAIYGSPKSTPKNILSKPLVITTELCVPLGETFKNGGGTAIDCCSENCENEFETNKTIKKNNNTFFNL